jgi:pilus assembly protein CpaC
MHISDYKSTSFGMAALGVILMLAPSCMAQDLPVKVTPSVPPPTAPAISLPPAKTVSASPATSTVSIVNPGSIPGALASISRNAALGKPLHVTLGHSLFIDTATRLRRVYVSDPSIITSVTLTPNQLIITGMNPGITSLTLLDEANQAQSYVISSDLDLDGLRAAMASAVKGDGIKIEGNGGRVTLSGTVPSAAIADSAVKLASLYSKDVANAMVVAPVHPKQVRLEVRILEVDRTKALQLGVNLFSPGGNNTIGASTSSQFPTLANLAQSATQSVVTTSNPLNFFLYNFKYNIGTTIQDLQTKQVLQILAEPTITTISGEKANFLSGGEFPFPIVQPGGNGGAPVVTIQFRPFGVKLEFTPIVNDDGTIRLKVAPEVSALDYANAVTVSGFSIPALSTRKAETEVELRSSQSFAISGLLDQRTTDIMSKNPGAANIPILGYLFKSKSTNHNATELVVVVTPTVVDPLTETTNPAQPTLPIEPLDRGGFDKSLGSNLNPHPAAPPLGPGIPPYGNPLPQTAPAAAAPVAPTPEPVSAPAGGAAGDVAPAPTPQGSPASAAPVPKPSPAVGTDPVIAAKPSMVEVMALSHASDADVMVAALKRRGYDVAVNQTSHDSLLHLDVGPFTNKQDAESMRQKLLNDGYNATMK